MLSVMLPSLRTISTDPFVLDKAFTKACTNPCYEYALFCVQFRDKPVNVNVR